MPRGLTADQKSALSARVKRPVWFVSLALTPVLRIWNGVGSVTTLSQTWAGVGEFGILQGLNNSRSLRATDIAITLAGLPGAAIPDGAIEKSRGVRYQGKEVKVYFGLTNPDTDVLLAAPTLIWTGVADVMTFELGETVTATLTAEGLSSRMRRASGLRMTTESHNARLGNPSPRDLFFEPQDRLMGAPRPLLSG